MRCVSLSKIHFASQIIVTQVDGFFNYKGRIGSGMLLSAEKGYGQHRAALYERAQSWYFEVL
jgi:hypothetical protein